MTRKGGESSLVAWGTHLLDVERRKKKGGGRESGAVSSTPDAPLAAAANPAAQSTHRESWDTDKDWEFGLELIERIRALSNDLAQKEQDRAYLEVQKNALEAELLGQRPALEMAISREGFEKRHAEKAEAALHDEHERYVNQKARVKELEERIHLAFNAHHRGNDPECAFIEMPMAELRELKPAPPAPDGERTAK